MKQKRKQYLSSLLGLTVLLVCSCQESPKDPIRQDSFSSEIQKTEDKVLSTFASLMNFSPSGLRAASRERVGEEDVYITNFSPGGFLLYGEDSLGTISVYGVSGEGELHTKDSIQTPVLRVIFDNAVRIKSIEDKVVTVIDGMPDVPVIDEPIHIDSTTYPLYYSEIVPGESVVRYKPSTLLFNQSAPFEDYLPGKETKDALGCANAALAMLASHYRVPDVIWTEKEETTIDWNTLWNKPSNNTWLGYITEDESCRHQIAEMCCFLYYDVSHLWSTPDHTIVTPSAVERFLKRWKFNPQKKTYNSKELRDYLETYKRPLLLYGESSFTDRHYWVVDGYLDFYQDRIVRVFKDKDSQLEIDRIEKRVYQHRLVHCNWGWGGKYNGFYRSGIFIPLNNPPHEDVSPFYNLKDKEVGIADYSHDMLVYYTYPSIKRPSIWAHFLL